jgi:DNA modification methylase
VSLYEDLLKRSARPGDSVLDPFAGSGTIFPAAHSLKIKATGIELDPSAYGIAVKRLGELP